MVKSWNIIERNGFWHRMTAREAKIHLHFTGTGSVGWNAARFFEDHIIGKMRYFSFQILIEQTVSDGNIRYRRHFISIPLPEKIIL
jgi:hypothetical protein